VLQHWSLEDQIEYSHLRALLTSLGAKIERDDKDDKAMSLSLIESYLNFRSQDNEDDSQCVSSKQSDIFEMSSKSDATYRSGSINIDINGSMKSDQIFKKDETVKERERDKEGEREVSEARSDSNHINTKGVKDELRGDSTRSDEEADIASDTFHNPTSGIQHQHSVESEREQECVPESASESGRGDAEEVRDEDEMEALAAFLEASKACEAKALQRLKEEEERAREREREKERENEREREIERTREEEEESERVEKDKRERIREKEIKSGMDEETVKVDMKLSLEREGEGEGEEAALKAAITGKHNEKETEMKMDEIEMNAGPVKVDMGKPTAGTAGVAATVIKGGDERSQLIEEKNGEKDLEKEGVKAVKGLRERIEELPVQYFENNLSSNSSQTNSKPLQQAALPSPVIHYHSPPSRSPPSRSPQSQSPSKAQTRPSSQPQLQPLPSTADQVPAPSRPPSIIHYHAPPSNRSPTQSVTVATTARTVEQRDSVLRRESPSGVEVGQGMSRQLVDDSDEDESAEGEGEGEGDKGRGREDGKRDKSDHEVALVELNHQNRRGEERDADLVVESIASSLEEKAKDREHLESKEREREDEGSVANRVHGVMEKDDVVTEKEKERLAQERVNTMEGGDHINVQQKVKGNEQEKVDELGMEVEIGRGYAREEEKEEREKEEREKEEREKEEREKKIQIAQERERERRRTIFKELEEQQIAQEALHEKHQEEIKQQQEELQILKSQVAKKVADKEREKDELKAIRDKLLLEAEHRRAVSIDIIPKQSKDDVMDEEKYKKLKNGTYEFGKIEMKEKCILNDSTTKSPNKKTNNNVNANPNKSANHVNKNESKISDKNEENKKKVLNSTNPSLESELEDPYEEIQKDPHTHSHKHTRTHTYKDRSSLPDRSSFDFLSPKDRSIRNSQMRKLDAQKQNSAANNPRSSPQKLNMPIADHIQVRLFLLL
jgi:hypothetical protein